MLMVLTGFAALLSLQTLDMPGLTEGVQARCSPVAAHVVQTPILATVTPEGHPFASFEEVHGGKTLRAERFTSESGHVILLSEPGEVAPYLRHVCVVNTNDFDTADTRRAISWSMQRVLDVIFLQPLPVVPE